MLRDQVAKRMRRSWMWYICTCVRALVQMYPPFRISESAIRWTDCAQIRYVVIAILARHFTKVDDGVGRAKHAHVSPLFRISRTDRGIELKFGVWLLGPTAMLF